jgi:MFS family permease
MCTAAVVTLFAIFMTSLCTQYYQFILAQGVLLGIGMSFLFVPTISTVAQHFKTNRAFALGIAVSGSSIGGVIWPIALHRLFNEVNFGWTLRIVGFIMLPLLGSACLFVRLPMEGNGHQKPKADSSFLGNPKLILLAIGLFFIYLGLFSPLYYITSYTVSFGLDANMAFYMVSIANSASLFGRILPGLLADRYGVFNIMVLAALISGLVCLCWIKATSIAGIIMLSIAYGFSSGVRMITTCPHLLLIL